jgi:hypothetical protein
MRLHQPVLFTEKGAVIQPQKRKSESKRKNSALGSLFWYVEKAF